MSIVSESEFKGNPMIVIKNDEEDKFPFQFGVKKAKLILENIEEIKKFVEKNDKQKHRGKGMFFVLRNKFAKNILTFID